jgi:hypothetical protein
MSFVQGLIGPSAFTWWLHSPRCSICGRWKCKRPINVIPTGISSQYPAGRWRQWNRVGQRHFCVVECSLVLLERRDIQLWLNESLALKCSAFLYGLAIIVETIEGYLPPDHLVAALPVLDLGYTGTCGCCACACDDGASA